MLRDLSVSRHGERNKKLSLQYITVRAFYTGTEYRSAVGNVDTGFYMPKGDLLVTARENGFETGQDNGVSFKEALRPAFEQDEVYRIEVFGFNEGVIISLTSGNEQLTRYLENYIERRSRGNSDYTFQGTGEPELPVDSEDEDELLEIYGDWALEHGDVADIVLEPGTSAALDEENQER
ncbi:MAG: hypothetical protein ABEJ69_00700 [Candidatus Nanohaloarchaea archaeon]